MDLIVYCIIYPIEAFILWHYCSNMFMAKYKKHIQLLGLFPLYITLILIATLQNVLMNMIAFTFINFIYLFVFYDSKWYSAVFHASVISCIMGLTEVAVLSIMSKFLYNFYTEDSHLGRTLILAILSKLLYFLILHAIIYSYSYSKEKDAKLTKGTGILIIIPAITTWIIATLASLCVTVKLTLFLEILIAISALLLLIVNFLVFSIYRYNQQKEAEYIEMQLQLQKEYDTAEYYKLLLEEDEAKSILIHDIKKHLNSIALLNEQNEQDKINIYINNIISSSSLQTSVRICDNDILNAILCRYTRNANEKGISMRIDIRSGCLTFMHDDDLTTLFCNLLDNAMDAADLVSDGYVELNIMPKSNTSFTVLTMINSCRTNPFDAQGKLHSSKPNKMRHGYGIKSIGRITDKYGGDMKVYYDEETRTFHTIIMLKTPTL